MREKDILRLSDPSRKVGTSKFDRDPVVTRELGFYKRAADLMLAGNKEEAKVGKKISKYSDSLEKMINYRSAVISKSKEYRFLYNSDIKSSLKSTSRAIDKNKKLACRYSRKNAIRFGKLKRYYDVIESIVASVPQSYSEEEARAKIYDIMVGNRNNKTLGRKLVK